jgi:hypothetical protein
MLGLNRHRSTTTSARVGRDGLAVPAVASALGCLLSPDLALRSMGLRSLCAEPARPESRRPMIAS